LHVLLYHIAVLAFYSFSLVFLYRYICFACWTLANFTFSGPCYMMHICDKDQPDAHFSL